MNEDLKQAMFRKAYQLEGIIDSSKRKPSGTLEEYRTITRTLAKLSLTDEYEEWKKKSVEGSENNDN